MKTLKEINVKDYELSRVQSHVRDIFRVLTPKAIIDGILLSEISLVLGTPYRLSHKLNRDYRGWIVTSKDADANIWESATTMPSKEIILNASANTIISLWVF